MSTRVSRLSTAVGLSQKSQFDATLLFTAQIACVPLCSRLGLFGDFMRREPRPDCNCPSIELTLTVLMSCGPTCTQDWVVQALSSNSALPEAVAGGRARGGGGGGGDAWRDDSDEEDDEDQEPLDEVPRSQAQKQKAQHTARGGEMDTPPRPIFNRSIAPQRRRRCPPSPRMVVLDTSRRGRSADVSGSFRTHVSEPLR